jgi:maltose O-acetyltransferase
VSDQRSEKEKMLAGELYRAIGSELAADNLRADRLLRAYNATGADEAERRNALLSELLGAGAAVRPPFHCDYGRNISLGRRTFVNFSCVFLDVAPIFFGDDCQVGPTVQIYGADHPRDPDLRREGYESGAPVRVGNNVWIGGGAIILPGVSIGDGAIIGAGSVVTRDVPPGATAVGNPARILSRERSTPAPMLSTSAARRLKGKPDEHDR